MSKLPEQFIASAFTGWSGSSFMVYLGCVAMTQFFGSQWFGPNFFGEAWIRMAFPQAKTEEERKRITQDTHMGAAYTSAMVGSASALFLVRATIILFTEEKGGSTAVDGAFVGFLLWIVDAVFGIMHPFFESKPFAFYVINQGYHMVCLVTAATILGAFG